MEGGSEMSDTPETDAEAMDGIDGYGDPLKTWDYKASKDGEVVPAEFARRLERERDEARTIAKMAYIRMTGLGVSTHTPIQLMHDAIKQWKQEEAK
jgi:hypothetical protein